MLDTRNCSRTREQLCVIQSIDPIVGRLRYFDSVNNVTVITEGERIITAITGRVGL